MCHHSYILKGSKKQTFFKNININLFLTYMAHSHYNGLTNKKEICRITLKIKHDQEFAIIKLHS